MKIIIVGGGPGGYEAAIRGAQLGGEIVLIEKDQLGGTCLNAGCIPTKVLYSHAKQFDQVKHCSNFGITVSSPVLDMKKVHENKEATIKHLRDGVEALIKANHIEYIQGEAELIDNNRVRVEENGVTEIIYGDYMIIATGSKPIMPPIPGIQSFRIMNSKQFLSFTELPKSLTIVGGGVIGMEFASIYNEMGTQVTVVDGQKSILSGVDKDISKRLMTILKKKGIEFITEGMIQGFKEESDHIKVIYTKKDKELELTSEYVLLAIGREPNLIPGLNHLNIEHDRKGIYVNNKYQTNIKNIYAIGDVNGKNMLAHAASHQGQSAVEHILLSEFEAEEPVIPGCIFSLPEIAVVGESEESMKAKDIPFTVSKFNFLHNGKAMTMQEDVGFVKVIASEDQLVGVQIIGPHASDLIHEATLGITNNLKVNDYIKTVHAHPTLAEAFLEAVRGINGEAIHSIPTMNSNPVKVNNQDYAVN
ncbi:MAG: dihydrolipoyl dehydrogenase [Clostridia bacterium]|nr:dihydrolipoyl dehydrogenase [Clostridia bacterium]